MYPVNFLPTIDIKTHIYTIVNTIHTSEALKTQLM